MEMWYVIFVFIVVIVDMHKLNCSLM